MRINDWSSDVCSSDLDGIEEFAHGPRVRFGLPFTRSGVPGNVVGAQRGAQFGGEEHHAAILPSCACAWRESSQSAALVAALAARKMARLSSRSTSSHEAM